MGRIRKTTAGKTQPRQIIWKVGKYIRLSHEDGNVISESVVNQDSILNDEIPTFFQDGGYDIVDTYIDDGTSGTTDLERSDFQRMVQDVTAGRINCIVVKNLSRAFRNSANQGHFLEEFIPLYNTRFISLYQPRIDTFLDPEITHSLEVSITGFMNEQYAYKTSADVRRTFQHKRENGAFIGAFAPYGYSKNPEDKNALVIDEDAALVVRDMFSWFITDGMSKAGIAKRLNELGIPNPTAYKQSKGFHYENPHATSNDGLWNPTTVSRMLQDSLYTGVMRQGRQKVISYKIHRRIAVPEDKWFVVENSVPPIISHALFQAAQELHRRDTRTAPGARVVYPFSGLIRCADCGKGMGRHSAKNHVYYACRTFTQKSKERCTKHSIRLDVLENAVLTAVQRQIALVSSLEAVTLEISRTPMVDTDSVRLSTLRNQRMKEREKISGLLDSLYMDWKSGDISHEQYSRMRVKCEAQVKQIQIAIDHIQRQYDTKICDTPIEDPYLTAFLRDQNIQSLSRGLLVALVSAVSVHEGGGLEIVFNFADPFRCVADFPEKRKDECDVPMRNVRSSVAQI